MAERKRKGLLFDEVLPRAKRTAQSLLSLDPQEDVPASQQALEMALGFVPGVGQAMALRDIERARRAEDPAAAAMAAASFIPFGRLLGRGNAGPIMSELDVYHGTPHRFPATEANPLGEFDASKIGTGEGAQAYGHGIYLAEAPGTAEIYKRALAEDVVAVDGNRIAAKRSVDARRDPESIAVNALISAQSGQVDDPFATAMQRLGGKYGPRNEYDAKAIEVIRNWRNKGAKIEEGGVMYKADLPDEMIDRMLDYDKPINEHSQVVLDALEKAGINTQSAMRAGQMIEGQEAHLAKFGIPGIIYREGRGKGPRNFVVFPGEEKKVRILERK